MRASFVAEQQHYLIPLPFFLLRHFLSQCLGIFRERARKNTGDIVLALWLGYASHIYMDGGGYYR